MSSEYVILTLDGEEKINLNNIENYPVINNNPELKQYILSEEIGGGSHKPPEHIPYLRQLELLDYEPASDIGHFRWYPKGAFLKFLIEEYAIWAATNWLKALRIETPMMYRYDEPDIKEQAEKFVEKDYRIKLGKKILLLRFAGDFGLFRMMKDVQLSYKQMPIRIFELSPSFRLEKRGECVGLRRMRHFTMPDIHCFCMNFEQALEEYFELTVFYHNILQGLGLNYVLVFRIVKEYYDKNKDLLTKIVKTLNKPAFIEILPSMKHYWALKSEYQILDSVGGNAQLSTVQLDVEDAERYGITYVDEKGDNKGCIILHSSMGSIERIIYALLENALKSKIENKLPVLPLWLSPTQVRIIPVASRHIESAMKLAEKINQYNIRVDVDDREKSVGKRIMDAEKRDWTPYIVIMGDKEVQANILTVRDRYGALKNKPAIKNMSIEELINNIKEKVKDKPFKPLPLPILLSNRPIFV
ncbi:MAG: threonine--tRNA ligase [Candidatus Odinarchaeia archaeon]